MARRHPFRKCETCGTHGHGGKKCPVFELNQQQEADLKLGLTPQLEDQIQQIRKQWREEHRNSPMTPMPIPDGQRQVSAGFATRAAELLSGRWGKCAYLVLSGLLLLTSAPSEAGTITGQVQTATGGVVGNGTLSFRLSQPAVLSGTATLVTAPVSCYTSTAGNIVGLPDPLVLPIVSTNTGSGTLAAGTYYVKVTYSGAGGETVASPESPVVLSALGTLIISPPALQPPSATGYKVYISSASGTETLQGSVTGFISSFSQSVPLVSGAALPSSNSTVCSVVFSDQLVPSGTYYSVSLVNKNGSSIAGFPQTWCTYGGQSGTINVSNGAPTGNCGSNGVFYPTPILANPPNNSSQSISSPIAFPGGIFGTTTFNGPVLFPNGILGNTSVGGNWLPDADNTRTLGDATHRWQGFFGTTTAKTFNAIRMADQFTGADCGAKINAADTDLGATPGEIWVNQNCGLTITTAVTLSAKHVLRFIQGGTWTQSASITLLDDSTITAPATGWNEDVLTLMDPAVVLKQAASANLTMLVIVKGQNVALTNFAIDGNHRGGGNASTVGVGFDNSGGAPNNRGRFHMDYMTVEECGGDNLQITSDVAGNNQAIGPKVTNSSFNRSFGGSGILVTRTTDAFFSYDKFELNNGAGLKSVDSPGLVENSDISTNNGGQINIGYDATSQSFGFMQGGWTILHNGITTTALGSALTDTANSSIIINGYNGTSCGLGAISTIAFNTISVQTGLQTNTIDGIRLVDTNSQAVIGNSILSDAGGTYKFKYAIDDTHSGSCASVLASVYTGNRFINTFGTGYYNLNASANAFGNIFSTTSQEQRTRTSSTCATAASVGAVCTTVVTWPNAFADANYSANCAGDVITSGIPVNGGFSAKAAGSVTFRTVATTAAAAQFTNIDCFAQHD